MTKGKFNNIKLSYTSSHVAGTLSIPDELFNTLIETRMRDNQCTMYEALIYCVNKLALIFAENDLLSFNFECLDDMGFTIKIER